MPNIKNVISKNLNSLFLRLRLAMKKKEAFSFSGAKFPVHLRDNSSDVPTFHQIFTLKDYDIPLKFEPKIIIDAGANIGLASVFFSGKYNNPSIVCIEPELSNFEMIQKNVRNYPNVKPLRAALSNENNVTLNIVDRGYGNWGFVTDNAEQPSEGTVIDSIKTITIDQVMAENNFSHIDILKIDIEGAERELFSGGYENWLPKTRCLFIELHDGIKKGASKAFFHAISQYEFYYFQKGENLVFLNYRDVTA